MKRIIASSLILPFAMGLAACDVDQTQDGEMPEVKVEGGQLPEYDVETAEVEVGTKETTV